MSRVSRALGSALVVLALIATGCASKSSAPSGGGTAPKELDSPDIGGGGTFEHRFFNTGDFGYHCKYHSGMTGLVSVNAGASDTLANVHISSNTSPFPGASIKPGGKVTWHNGTSAPHSVTSH